MIQSTVSRSQQTVEIARRVKDAASSGGFGLAQIAAALAVHRSEAAQVLSGEREISVPELLALAQLIDVSPIDLLPARNANGSDLS